MNLHEMEEAFRRARGKYTADGRQPNHINVEDLVDHLRNVAIAAVYAENEEGGKARGVVADVARVLGVDIDEGDGHRWNEDHMRRVVDAAAELRGELGWLQMADERRSEVLATDVNELRATIVRQANEITALKGDSA